MMIPHHQDAVDMAELALTQARRPELKTLADAIIQSPSREIKEIKQWYQEWYGGQRP